MGKKVAEVSIPVRDLIIQSWKNTENGPISERKLSNMFNIPKTTVHDIIQKFKNMGSVANLKGRGRKPILSTREVRQIVRKVKENPFVSAPKLSEMAGSEFGKKIGPKSIQRILNNNEFHGRRPQKKPYISKKNQIKRLAYARKYVSKPLTFWESIIWSDETKVNLFGSDGHKKVWRKKGKALDRKNLTPTIKHGGGSIMV